MTLEDRYATSTPEGVVLDVALAGLGSRFVALLLDSVVQAAGVILFSVAIVVISPSVHGRAASIIFSGALALFILLDLLGYFVICEMLFSGRTIGKMITGLRVIRVGGGAIGFWSSLLRNVLRLVDVLPSFYLIGCVAVLASSRNQRLGDLAAGTLVIREHVAAQTQRNLPWGSAAGFERPLLAGPGGATERAVAMLPPELASWDVSAVPEAELQLARRFLENRAGYAPEARSGLATDLANRIWPYVAGPAAPSHPEHFLEAVIIVKSARG